MFDKQRIQHRVCDMKAIFKYPLKHVPEQTIEVHQISKVLTVQIQRGDYFLWAEVDTVAKQGITIEMFGTGWEMEPTVREYISTVQDGPGVWHFYRKLS